MNREGELVLVTGANGFLGRAIVRRLLDDGRSVRALVRHAVGLPTGVQAIEGDFGDGSTLQRAVSGVSDLIHAAGAAHRSAATDPAVFRQGNIDTARDVAQAAVRAGVPRLVLVSSVSVYGPTEGLVPESHPCHPDSEYGRSKLAGEQAVRDVTRNTSTGVAILRLVTLVGEEDPGNVLRLIRTIDRGLFVPIGRGSNHKSLLHRDDAARACVAALAPSQGDGLFNVSAGVLTMTSIVGIICDALGRPRPRWSVDPRLARAGARVVSRFARIAGMRRDFTGAVDKWLSDDAYDGARFARDHAFVPAVPIPEAIAREVSWYRAGAP